jgi:hypothetical protein
MNAKLIFLISCVAALALPASVAMGQHPRGGSGQHWSGGNWSGQRWGGGTWSGGNWSGQRWGGGNWSGNWSHHHHHNNDVIFIGSFGFPWWGGWGYPYGYGYGYGYGYPYGYGYGYPYGYGYGAPYGYGYGNPYGYGYGNDYYGGSAYGYGTRSRVAQVQRRLARAGYYHGTIDGIMGPQTRRAIRAYERDHGMNAYGVIDRRLLATLGAT